MGFYKEKVVRTRKEHRCWGCGKVLEIGLRVKCVRGTNDSEDAIGTWYYCDVCDDYMNNKADDDDRWHWANYGIALGDILTCRQERELDVSRNNGK